MKSYMCLFFVLFASCANIIPPDGGPKDLTPPLVISATPQNPNIYFQNKTITLVFDEYIQLKNIEEIKISPKCGPNPKIILKGKKLEIKLRCSLQENTTYTINFGKSILDITEGNILTNFKYVFSTGSYLDSLFITGSVKDLYSNKHLEGVLIGLSNNMDSLNPYYYTFSNENGDFNLQNIKDSEYLLFAFLDENNNFRYDSGELISMPETIQDLNSTKNLGLFYEKSEKSITNVKNINNHTILFEHSILNDSIIILNAEGWWNVGETSSIFWFNKSPNFIKYSHRGRLDSIAISNPDSLQKVSFQLISKLHQINNEKLINIEVNVPIKDVISEKFSWKLDSAALNPRIINPFVIQIPIESNVNKSQKLIINTDALIVQNGNTNDSTDFYIDFNQEKYGSLKIKSEIADTNLVVELFDNNTTIRKRNLKDSVLIDWIVPGNYNVRVFIDKNNNNHWDSGNILKRELSEKIIIYPEIIKVRANWEIDVILDEP